MNNKNRGQRIERGEDKNSTTFTDTALQIEQDKSEDSHYNLK